VAGPTCCWRSLSKQGLQWRVALKRGASLLALTATLFCVYDSLIEKCSTLSRLCAAAGVPCFSHLSVADITEWVSWKDTTPEVVSARHSTLSNLENGVRI
jgi:hypothetical protein